MVAVHNGIFENFLELRRELAAAGSTFITETDTECFPVMVAHLMKGGLSFPEAFRQAVGRMHGIYAIACMHADDPGRILAARSGPPLVVGIGEGEQFLASDVVPLLRHTRQVVYLEDGDLAELTRDGVRLFRQDGSPIERPVRSVPFDPRGRREGPFQALHAEGDLRAAPGSLPTPCWTACPSTAAPFPWNSLSPKKSCAASGAS